MSSPPTVAAPRVAPLTPVTLSLTLLTVVLWSGNPVATSFSADALPPVAISGLRFLMATIFMFGWCVVERVSFRLTWEQWPPVLIAGFLLFLQIWTFTVGVAWSSSSHSSLFINTYPFWVLATDHFVTRHHRLTGVRFLGVVVAAAGVVFLLTSTATHGAAAQRDEPTIAGDLMTLLSAALFAAKLLYSKHAIKIVPPTPLTFWHDVVAVVLFAACSLSFEVVDLTRLSAAAWLALGYQGFLVGGLCFGLQTQLLKWHSASQVAIFSFATPLFGVLLGAALRGDRLSWGIVVSGLAIAAGIYLVNRPQRSRITSEA